eukprot:6528818-Pyramimonas_sp.AAC.1
MFPPYYYHHFPSRFTLNIPTLKKHAPPRCQTTRRLHGSNYTWVFTDTALTASLSSLLYHPPALPPNNHTAGLPHSSTYVTSI